MRRFALALAALLLVGNALAGVRATLDPPQVGAGEPAHLTLSYEGQTRSSSFRGRRKSMCSCQAERSTLGRAADIGNRLLELFCRGRFHRCLTPINPMLFEQ